LLWPVQSQTLLSTPLPGLEWLPIVLHQTTISGLTTAIPNEPKIIEAMRQHPYGKDAAVIGRVLESGKAQVRLKTAIGGTRLVDMLPGEMLPRIC